MAAMLREDGLSRSSISPLICESFYQSVHSHRMSGGHADDASGIGDFMSGQLQTCREQLQRRRFLMKHCSAETRLALAACDWAAEKSQVCYPAPEDDILFLLILCCALCFP